jgi:hypothetical protein
MEMHETRDICCCNECGNRIEVSKNQLYEECMECGNNIEVSKNLLQCKRDAPSIMHGVAITSMELMSQEHRTICVKFLLSQLQKNGEITEDDSRTVIDFSLKLMEKEKDGNKNKTEL